MDLSIFDDLYLRNGPGYPQIFCHILGHLGPRDQMYQV